MNNIYENLLLELGELYNLSRLYRDSKLRKYTIDQLKLVKDNIIISQDKDLIKLVENYYLDLPLAIFLIKIKLQTPPILGVIILIIAAAAIRNAYINGSLIITFILGMIVLFGAFIVGYLAYTRENTAQRIGSFSYEAIKILEEKMSKKRK